MKLKWGYWKLTLRDSFVGIILGNLPVFPLLFILGVITTGKLVGMEIHGCPKNDKECWRSMFDSFEPPGVSLKVM